MKKWYRVIVVSYIVVFIIPMILNIHSLQEIKSTAKNDISRNISDNLEHVSTNLDNTVRKIEDMIEMLMENEDIVYMATKMNTESSHKEFSRQQEVKRYLKKMGLPMFVDDFYLYLDEAGMILTSQTVFLEQERGENYFFRYDMENSGDVLYEIMKEKTYGNILPSRPTMQNGRKTEKMVYLQSMCSYTGKKVGTFVFPINTGEIEKLLRDMYIPSKGWLYMENASGETIMEVTSEDGRMEKILQEPDRGQNVFQTVLDREPVCVIRYTSEKTGICFTAVIPEENMSADIREKQKTFFVMIFCVTFLGAVLIYGLSVWRGRKLSGILTQNERMNEVIRQQEPLMKGFLIEKLLKSDEESISVSMKNLKEYGITFSVMQRFGIVIFKIQGEESQEAPDARKMEICKVLLQEKLYEIFREDFWVCNPELSYSAVLFVIDSDVKDMKVRWNEQFAELVSWFANEQRVRLNVVVSSICDSIHEIHKVYDRLQEVLEFHKEQKYQIYYCDEDKEKTYFYYYPITLEERLMNAVYSGESKVLNMQLQQIYAVNVLERNISFSMMNFLLNDMQCTALKLLHSFQESGKWDVSDICKMEERANGEKNLLRRFQSVAEIFKRLCELVAEQEQNEDDEIVREMQKYFSENYSSQELSLVKMAEDFGYESSYFSKRFKGLFGENFATYLEKIRIEHICEFLETSMTLEQIAEKTGYSNAHVMRMAFKRKKGITPNEWRKLKKNNTYTQGEENSVWKEKSNAGDTAVERE